MTPKERTRRVVVPYQDHHLFASDLAQLIVAQRAEQAIEDAITDERATIVAWLMARAQQPFAADHRDTIMTLADQIDRGLATP